MVARSKKLKSVLACMLACSILTTSGIVTYRAEKVSAATQQQIKRNVMYYGDWSIWDGQGRFYPKDIPADQLTHLNFAFLDFNDKGELIFTDKDAAVAASIGMPDVQWGAANAGVLNGFQDLKATNPNLKIGVSLGGWSKSGEFSTIAASSTLRAKFVENVIKFIEYCNMDFVDIDWEYPCAVRPADKVDNANDEGTLLSKPEDKENFILLLKDFKAALDKKGKELGRTYELSVAIPASKPQVDKGINVKSLFEVVDFANIMTYDMRGAWDETSGHQTGLYTNPNDPLKANKLSVDDSVKYYLSQGAKSEKIVIGAAYYTRGWGKVSAGPDSKTPGLFGNAEYCGQDANQDKSRGAKNEAPVKNGDGGRLGGVWSYRSLSALKIEYPGLKEYWDDVAKAPYLYDEKTGAFFTYDNVRSIQEKAKYVNDNNLGGMIAWMASQDATTTSTKRDQLTKATNEALNGKNSLPKNNLVAPKLDVECIVKPYVDNGTSSSGYEITIKNNEKKNESGDVLQAVEALGEAIKTPKLYIKTNSNLTAGDHMAGTVKNLNNGYTLVDISGVYEAKVLEQGKSYTFKLKASDAKVDASNIKTIDLAQSIYAGGAELGRQCIYGVPSTPDGVNEAPEIYGAKNQDITIGDKFDPMAGVSALDREDGNITSKIIVTGTVDTSKIGSYKITYSVKDSGGLEVKVDVTINVKDKVAEQYEAWSNSVQSNQGYAAGVKVTHNGKVYLQTGGYTGTGRVWYGEPGTPSGDSYWKAI